MPGVTEYSARLRPPEWFDKKSFRRMAISPGIFLLIGKILGRKTTTAQSIRFKKEYFTKSQAERWVSKYVRKR
jgi:hypothetical protein